MKSDEKIMIMFDDFGYYIVTGEGETPTFSELFRYPSEELDMKPLHWVNSIDEYLKLIAPKCEILLSIFIYEFNKKLVN